MEDYPRLDQLGIPWNREPVAHVFNEDVEGALADNGLDQGEFNKLFGIQTCPVVDGKMCMYPWDVEAVLERMISGERTGSQRFWD